MTIDDVKRGIEKIQAAAHDNEKAHAMEDDLRDAVLKAIADGCDNAPRLARLALATSEISFARWYS